MKYRPILFTAALAAAVTAPAQALATPRTVPPASFLEYHVDTVPELSFEVNYDRVVRERLAHHFHLSGQAMSAYVRDNLALQHLRAPLRTRVYCVSPRGREYFVVMTLKAGSPVFALRRTGQPILRLVCGNPLVAALPPTPKPKAAKPAAKAVAKTPANTLVKAAQAAQATPVLDSADAAPAAWTVPDITTSASGETLFTQGASSASGAGWLALLPVLAGVFAFHNGSGGGQSVAPTVGVAHTTLIPSTTLTSTPAPTTIFTQPTPTQPAAPSAPTGPTLPLAPIGGGPGGQAPGGPAPGGPAPVPEPSPAGVFALGGLALAALRLRRK